MSEAGSRSAEFVAGIKAELPLLLGVTPFGVAYGVNAIELGLSPWLAQGMSVIVFGGLSQLVGAQQMAAEVPGLIIVFTALLVNSRHSLYSAAIAPRVEGLSARWRWLLAYLLTDEGYVAGAERYTREDPSPNKHWFLLGALVALWVVWQVATAVGVFLGRAVPDSWSLGFTLPLTFIAIVVPTLRERPAIAAALVAGTLATIGFRWQYGLNVLIPALAGLGAALAVRRRSGAHIETEPSA
jgi:4-azaleucine resistance transporter AzlC